MPRRKEKKASRGRSVDDANADAAADYLSESHTIATIHSGGTASGENTNFNDDPDWNIDDDDYIQNGPSDQQVEAAEQRHAKLIESFSQLDEFTQEKRASKREALLKVWFKALTQYASVPNSSDYICQKREALVAACRFSIRTGTPSEQYSACRVVEALAVVLQAEEGLYPDVEEYLSRVISSTHRATPVRSAALRALGMVVYMGVESNDSEITEATLDICEALAQTEYRGQTVAPSLRGTALQVWTVLATTIHDLYVSGKDDMSTGRGLLLLPLILECLEQKEDMALRAAAGECVTYIHAVRVALGVNQNDLAEGQTLNTTQRQYQQGSWEGSEWEGVMAEIEQTISDLSTQSGHHLSKKAKKEQRSYFREYLATLQDNEDPEEVVQFRGGTLEVTSWKDIVVLRFVRRCLQGGFQLQLLTNPALQSIFGLALQQNHNDGMSQLEKRLHLSKTSEAVKLKDQDRHKKRDKRTNIKNHFLTADGEDM
jgi:Interferon-related developmental regulator (IFRD)